MRKGIAQNRCSGGANVERNCDFTNANWLFLKLKG